MLKNMRNHIKNQRGLTLIELLAVVVILGIISAIAVPSIGGLIDNTKKDAHVANAQQMVNSAKLAVTTDANLHEGILYIPLGYLEAQNFVESISDPDGGDYEDGGNVILDEEPTEDASYVTINDGKVTHVKLFSDGKSRGVQDTNGNPIPVGNLERGSVN